MFFIYFFLFKITLLIVLQIGVWVDECSLFSSEGFAVWSVEGRVSNIPIAILWNYNFDLIKILNIPYRLKILYTALNMPCFNFTLYKPETDLSHLTILEFSHITFFLHNSLQIIKLTEF